jgi:hypothetical protein
VFQAASSDVRTIMAMAFLRLKAGIIANRFRG